MSGKKKDFRQFLLFDPNRKLLWRVTTSVHIARVSILNIYMKYRAQNVATIHGGRGDGHGGAWKYQFQKECDCFKFKHAIQCSIYRR